MCIHIHLSVFQFFTHTLTFIYIYSFYLLVPVSFGSWPPAASLVSPHLPPRTSVDVFFRGFCFFSFLSYFFFRWRDHYHAHGHYHITGSALHFIFITHLIYMYQSGVSAGLSQFQLPHLHLYIGLFLTRIVTQGLVCLIVYTYSRRRDQGFHMVVIGCIIFRFLISLNLVFVVVLCGQFPCRLSHNIFWMPTGDI